MFFKHDRSGLTEEGNRVFEFSFNFYAEEKRREKEKHAISGNIERATREQIGAIFTRNGEMARNLQL